jgi:hypothetical protein
MLAKWVPEYRPALRPDYEALKRGKPLPLSLPAPAATAIDAIVPPAPDADVKTSRPSGPKVLAAPTILAAKTSRPAASAEGKGEPDGTPGIHPV